MAAAKESDVSTDLPVRRETGGSHVGTAHRFDLLHVLKITFIQQLHRQVMVIANIPFSRL